LRNKRIWDFLCDRKPYNITKKFQDTKISQNKKYIKVNGDLK